MHVLQYLNEKLEYILTLEIFSAEHKYILDYIID